MFLVLNEQRTMKRLIIDADKPVGAQAYHQHTAYAPELCAFCRSSGLTDTVWRMLRHRYYTTVRQTPNSLREVAAGQSEGIFLII